jgi:very-short-patch-repair endonuclease
MRHAASAFADTLNAFDGMALPPAAYSVMAEHRERCVAKWVQLGASQKLGEAKADAALAGYKAAAHLCESPIEHIALIAIATTVLPNTDMPRIYDMRKSHVWPSSTVIVAPQMPVGCYRLDFIISVRRGDNVTAYALECDGAQNHTERADKDADAVRDGFLAHIGIETRRITGSEIYRHAGRIQSWIVSLAEVCA